MPPLTVLETAIEVAPAQSHLTALAHQLVGATTVPMLQPRFRATDVVVIDVPAAKQIIDKGAGGRNRAWRFDRAGVGRR